MEAEKIDLIKNDVLQLLKQVYKEELILKEFQHDLRGIKMVFDCSEEAKPKILGKRGRHIRLVRRMIKIFGYMHYQANIYVFVLPDVKRI